MSKFKRRRQQNRRAANVHRYTVQQGLATCPYGECPDCRREATEGGAA